MRRCTSDNCLLAATRKSRLIGLDLPVVGILHTPSREWNAISRKGGIRVASEQRRALEVDWKKFNVNDYLFSHCTIVTSVATADNGYWIEPPCGELVNANGNAWTTPVLLATFKSFMGAENYYEHVQIPELSKGKILDAVLRHVTYVGKTGKKSDVLYCDILVATNRIHSDIVDRVESGELTTMSMGCGLAGTVINLPNGTFTTIEKIAIGDDVLSHTGNIRKVTSLFEYDAKDVPLFSVEYSGGYEPLRLTGEHPILVATKDSVKCSYSNRPCRVDADQSQCKYSLSLPWRCAGEKKPCGRDKSLYEYDMKFVPISEVSVGDYVAKVFPTDENDNELFTADICRLFGIYLGDGYIGWNWDRETRVKKTPSYIEFCLGMKETALIAEVKSLLESISPNSKVVEKIVKERSGIYIRVWDSKIAELFLRHGGEGAWTKKMSEEIMLLPKQKQKKIISGLIDTDGCFYEKKGTIHFSTASKDLWNQTHLMLLRLGVGNRQSSVFRNPSGFKSLTSSEMYLQYEIYIGKGQSWMVECSKNKVFGVNPTTTSDECFFHKNYYLCPVQKIGSVRVSAKVYNFSVEEDESYVVGNVAVHNCLAHVVQCSKCGKEIEDDSDNCEHLENELMQEFTDDNGVRRIVAELCGRSVKKNGIWVGDPDSVEFIEASWVERPAFKGAVLNHMISEPTEKHASLLNLSNYKLSSLFDDVQHMRVADTDGMMVLRVARAELLRLRRESLISRVSSCVQ